jgi:uncharacterized membrane protein HdeD (DUF308 family)
MAKIKSPDTRYNMKKSPSWLRFLQIGLGAISVILSIAVLAFPGVAVYTIMLLLSVALLVVGFERIAIGVAASYIRKSSRLANIGLGALAIIFSSMVMSFPLYTASFLILLGAFALLFNGIARIIQGAISKNISNWFRGLLIGVGALSIGVSALVVEHPIGIGVPLLAITMSIALLITGIQMVAVGIGGKSPLQYSESQVDDMK